MGRTRALLPGEAPQEARIQMAIQAYRAYEDKYNTSSPEVQKNMKKPSYREFALTYGINYANTLARRIKNETRNYHEAHVKQQTLIPEEERALVALAKVLLLTDVIKCSERFTCTQLRALGTEMLKQRDGGSKEKLGKGWVYKFLDRHPDLKDVFERRDREYAS